MWRPSPLTTVAIAGIVVLLFIAVSVGAVVKVAVDHLLYSEATAAAESWAKYVVENVSDIEDIAKGAQPSAESMTFFIRTQHIRDVFGFEITDPQGNVQLISDGRKISSLHGSIQDELAALAATSDQPVIQVKEGNPPLRPLHYSEAYLPVRDDTTHAVVAAYVDLTDNYNKFHNVFLVTVLTLCLLTGAGVSIPMIAWQRLTRQKQQADRRIRFLAAHDPLTSAMNRSTLIERLGWQLAALQPAGSGLALHFIDIDHFKDVNDRFGHDAGDVVLKTLVERFLAITRREDTIGRFGGDELIVLQYDVRERAGRSLCRAAAHRGRRSDRSEASVRRGYGEHRSRHFAGGRARFRPSDQERRSRFVREQGGRPQLRPAFYPRHGCGVRRAH